MSEIQSDLAQLPPLFSQEIQWESTDFTVARRKSIAENHWVIICQTKDAINIHKYLLAIGEKHNLRPAGSITFNTLRIRSGRPAGRELSQDYIPLEVGLWDEISFSKGCYTGQEIIARMESRERLAKTIVKLELTEFVEAPATLYDGEKSIGTMTSSVEAPDGTNYAIAVIKTDIAQTKTILSVGDAHTNATIKGYAGIQPAFLQES